MHHDNLLAPDKLEALQPLRDGLLQLHPPRLLGVLCGKCRTRTFPSRAFCPSCNSTEDLCSVALSPYGVVFSYTIVRQAPGTRPTPYVLAYIDLEDEVRVMAQVEAGREEVHIGMPVELALAAMHSEDGIARLGYKFVKTQRQKEKV